MTKKRKILNKYKKNLEILKKNNKFYYTDDSPKISDSEYDKIKLDTLELEKKYSFFAGIWFNTEYYWCKTFK